MPKSVTELAYIDEAGFHLADFEDFLAFNQDAFRQIYGQDVNLDADTQDGQWVTHIAQTQYDIASLCAATFNRFSPSTAEGDALRRQIKINGIKANPATHSTVDVVIVGDEGTASCGGNGRLYGRRQRFAIFVGIAQRVEHTFLGLSHIRCRRAAYRVWRGAYRWF